MGGGVVQTILHGHGQLFIYCIKKAEKVKIATNKDGKKVRVLKKSKSEVKKFIDPYHFPSALLLDSKINDFGSGIVLPMTYLLNRSGVIHKIYLPTKKVLTLKEIETDLGF